MIRNGVDAHVRRAMARIHMPSQSIPRTWAHLLYLEAYRRFSRTRSGQADMHAAECSAAFSANSPFGLLAYMATIHELRTAGKLIPYETELDVGEFRERWIDFTPSGVRWLEDVLPDEVSDAGRKLRPLEQVEQIFHDYIIGRMMQYGVHRKRLGSRLIKSTIR